MANHQTHSSNDIKHQAGFGSVNTRLWLLVNSQP